jgi:hypothetical protein
MFDFELIERMPVTLYEVGCFIGCLPPLRMAGSGKITCCSYGKNDG